MRALPDPIGLRLRLPVEPRTVPFGRHAVQDLAAQTGFDDDAQQRISLAVTEALSNVVIHAHRNDQRPPHHLELVVECDDQALRVCVLDDGCGLAPRSDSPGLGLGLSIMANSADQIDLQARPHGGTAVHLTVLR
jgi:serine/threonine-protein kinase RsbW